MPGGAVGLGPAARIAPLMLWTATDIPDLEGRVAVVTGGNGGLGLATLRQLVAHRATVVMAARDLKKARLAAEAVRSVAPGGDVEVLGLDLGSLASVRSFSEEMRRRHRVVDILVNNAGVMAPPWSQTADGFEMQLGVNHLGHFAMSALLLPMLLEAEQARIVTVTSFARLFRDPLDPADPHTAVGYDPWMSYGRSKMANFWFAVEFDRRLRSAGSAARSVAAHPGLTHTELQAESVRATEGGRGQRFWHFLARTLGAAPAAGARSVLRAATDPEVRGGELYGPLFGGWGPPVRRPTTASSRRPADLATLWHLSEQQTGIEFPI